ncbi:hypothetical protein VTN00DRAFT_7107 [Thermoascus crustaceus]|uniref:uncharacterized protein n=1 Tax=Thermoascus crustaceus TaxID=5088 RepID=UPI0037442E53
MARKQISTRWLPLEKYPLTGQLYKHVSKHAKARVNIVSERLCDDILHRLSPFLRRESPVDIVDFYPGAGLFSAKINDFLKPRRHVLLEAELKLYGKVLDDLAKRPSCKLLSIDRLAQGPEWPSFFAEHLPEQKPPTDNNRVYSRNDSLLVLANLTGFNAKAHNYTPSRRWTGYMVDCLKQATVNKYGMVRILALLPADEGEMVMPRTVHGRRMATMLTEANGRAFDVAASAETAAAWYGMKELDLITSNAARVAERTAENNVTVPEGRERPPVPVAPDVSEKGSIQAPYVPRPMIPFMQRYTDAAEELKKVEADKTATKATRNAAKERLKRQIIVLNQDNRRSIVRKKLREMQTEIDEQEVSLCRAAADPNADIKALKELDAKLAAARAEFDKLYSESEATVTDKSDVYIDDRRSALSRGSFDDAVLLWDRRPFEPLNIENEELYPREVPCNLIYFEPDADSSLMQALEKMDSRKRSDLTGLFEEVTRALGNKSNTTVADLLEAMFPGRSANDIVKAVPSLAPLASRRLKPVFEGHPPAAESQNNSSETPESSESTTAATSIDPKVGTDPVFSYQENINYDFRRVRVRTLPVSALWDLVAEYDRWPFKAKSAIEVGWALGGTMTEYKMALDSFEYKAGKAAGSIRKL